MTGPVTRLIYVHGLLSSPASGKAQLLRGLCAAEGWTFEAPDLNLAPRDVDRLLSDRIAALTPEERKRTFIVGSSLGGFYGLRLARRFGLAAAVVNPCLNPWDLIPGQTGERQIYGTDRFVTVLPEYADDLRALAAEVPPAPDPAESALVLLSTEDEVLDWRLADRALAQCPKLISTGDEHRMARFEAYLPAVAGFFRGFLAEEAQGVSSDSAK